MLLGTHMWLVRTPSCEVHRTCKTFPTYTILTMTPGELKKIYISGPRVRLAELETGGGLHVRWDFRIVFSPRLGATYGDFVYIYTRVGL
jgi:hypothetical protein